MDLSKVNEGWFIIPKHDIMGIGTPKRTIYKKGVKYKIFNKLLVIMGAGETYLMITECEPNVSIGNRYAHEFLIKDSLKINKKFKFVSLSKERIAKIKSLMS